MTLESMQNVKDAGIRAFEFWGWWNKDLSAIKAANPAAPSGDYQIDPDGDGGNGHQWRAEPLGRQREDGCGTLVLDHLGGKSVLGASVAGTRCWRGRP